MTRTVVHVMGPLRPSGMERMLVSAAEEFRKADVHTIVIGQGPSHPYAEELRDAGIEVHTTAELLEGRGMKLRRILRRAKPSAVNIHTEGHYLETAWHVRRAVGRRVRVARTVHSVFAATGRWAVSRFIQAVLGDRLIDEVIAPSEDVAIYERRNFRRARVILNWVDERFFAIAEERDRRTGKNPPLALIVGNCSHIKRHELALSALIDTDFIVAHLGSENEGGPIESQLLAQFDRQGRLAYRGIGDPLRWLAEADVFLMPSRHEGFSVALAEAIAARVPCIVADVPGLRWASQDPAVTYIQGDEVAWQNALRTIAARPEVRAATGIDLTAKRGAAEYLSAYGLAP